MSKTSTNLSLHEKIRGLATELQELLGYGSLSTMVEALIRDEHERRKGPLVLRDAPTPVSPIDQPARAVSYTGKSAVRTPLSPTAQAVILAAENEVRTTGAIAPPSEVPLPAQAPDAPPVRPPATRARVPKALKKPKTKFST